MRRSPAGPRPRLLALLIGLIAVLGGAAASAADAAVTGTVAISPLHPDPKPSGSPTTYTIGIECSGVAEGDQTCGSVPKITIPLAAGQTPDEGWTYTCPSSSPGGLVLSCAFDDAINELVILLDEAKIDPGVSSTFQLTVTPPNNVTPDGTSWTVEPTFETSEFSPVTVDEPANGKATAAASLKLTKDIADGSSFVINGNKVTYTVRPGCGSPTTAGNLYFESGKLVDQLPPGLKLLTPVLPGDQPQPVVTGTVAGGQTLTWIYANAAALPQGCGAGASGPVEYTVTAEIDASLGLIHDGDTLTNTAKFEATPIGANDPLEDDDSASIKVLDDAPDPTDPGYGGTITKTGVGPLSYDDQGVLRYIGTYAGNWMSDTVAAPNVNNPASAPGRFTTTIDYHGADAFQTDLIDPMPCMDDTSDRDFASLDVNGPATAGDAPSIDGSCAKPAFHPTVVRIDARSRAAAVAAGWRPVAMLVGGGQVDLQPVPGNGSYFSVPADKVGQVVAIRLPRNSALQDRVLRLDIFGYADESTEGGDTLTNVVSVSSYPTAGPASPRTRTDDARLVIEDEVPQLGAYKEFGSPQQTGADDDLHVVASLRLIGRVATPITPLTGDVVIADLLPVGMEWDNPVNTVTYRLSDRPGGPQTDIQGAVEYLENHENSGRNLMRITFPADRFAATGYYTLEPKTDFIRVRVPLGEQTYLNQTRTYVKGSGTNLSDTCTQGTTSTPSDIQTKDELDLDGDGNGAAQRSCSWNAPLNVPRPNGAAFALYKTVQGDLDDDAMRSPGIGEASEGGTGKYTLNWSNIGGGDLTDVTVYDVLPFIGDSGVKNVQTPRESAFRPVFTGITNGAALTAAGVTVYYSTSTNPCRPEVLPNASNSGCDPDWSTTPPTDVGDVRALRFTAPGAFGYRQGFKVEFGVDVPTHNRNVIAWNSAASVAKSNGQAMLPAEPPKVGIRAPGPLVTPVVTTNVAKSTIVRGAKAKDTITVAGAEGATGDIDWKLVGPTSPATDGTCDNVDWTGAATKDSGRITLQGDGDYDTPTTTLTAFGCYSYVVDVESKFFGAPGTFGHAAGALNEVVQVAPVTPTLTTQVSQATIDAAGSVRDTITLADNDDASGTLDWKLVGPKPIGSDGTCDNVDWTGAATIDSDTIAFDGGGDYDTTPTILPGAGCYSYVVEATSNQYLDPVGHPAGEANEVVLVRPATIVTEASSIRIAPGGEVTDRVELTGTGGGTGTLEWKLVGPIPANAVGTCEDLDWTGAQTFDSGTIAVSGDGTYTTDPSSPTDTGCYSYVQQLTDGSYGGPALSAAGAPNEMVYVGRPTVETTVSAASILTGGTLLDAIDVKGTGGGPGTLTWKLYGPVAPGAGNTCLGLNWIGAGLVAQGTIAVTGDGSYQTPPTLALLQTGCYGYEVTLDGQDYGGPVVSPAGTPGEVSLVVAPVVPQQTARVSIEKTASHRAVRAGTRITYTLTATNSGKGTARNVVITDTPQTGMRFVSATPEAGSCNDRFPLSCSVGSLAPGQKVAVKVVAVPTASGAVVNGVRVTTDTPNESPANEVVADARVVVKVPMRISKRASRKTVRAGSRVRFTVTVRNASKVPSGRAQVCDRMPSGLVLVSVKGTKVTRKAGQHCWTVPALKAGKSKRYTVTARALGGAKGKQINRVTLKGDSVQTKSARASVRVKAKPVRAGGVAG